MNIKDWYNLSKKKDSWCVGKGWKNILITLCDKIITIDDSIEIAQVKEKFGGLRFYIYSGNEEICNLINKAEEESFKTCEDCGTQENVSTNGSGWIRTLCNKCRERNDKL